MNDTLLSRLLKYHKTKQNRVNETKTNPLLAIGLNLINNVDESGFERSL